MAQVFLYGLLCIQERRIEVILLCACASVHVYGHFVHNVKIFPYLSRNIVRTRAAV